MLRDLGVGSESRCRVRADEDDASELPDYVRLLGIGPFGAVHVVAAAVCVRHSRSRVGIGHDSMSGSACVSIRPSFGHFWPQFPNRARENRTSAALYALNRVYTRHG